MGCTLFGMTPEALLGTTRIAAEAIGLGQSHGTIEVERPDLCVWRSTVNHPRQLSYFIGASNLLQMRIFKGQVQQLRNRL